MKMNLCIKNIFRTRPKKQMIPISNECTVLFTLHYANMVLFTLHTKCTVLFTLHKFIVLVDSGKVNLGPTSFRKPEEKREGYMLRYE